MPKRRSAWWLMMALLALPQFSYAERSSDYCSASSLLAHGLKNTRCESTNGLTFIQYEGAKTDSPYTTQFDVRSIAIMIGPDAKSVKAASGFPERAAVGSFRTQLTSPPFKEQIVSRHPEKKMLKYGEWAYVVEHIQYGAQGSARGYVVDCATAHKAASGHAVAISECFSIEERSRFLQTLSQFP